MSRGGPTAGTMKAIDRTVRALEAAADPKLRTSLQALVRTPRGRASVEQQLATVREWIPQLERALGSFRKVEPVLAQVLSRGFEA